MEIVTEEPLQIFSQLVIPILLLAVSGIIPAYITKYSKKRDKTQYINFLRLNFIIIESYLIAIQYYKARRLATVPIYTVLGIVTVLPFMLIMDSLLKRVLLYILKMDYIEKYFSGILNNLTGLNMVLFYYSCFYIISVLIILGIWFIWCHLLKSKNLGTPKITRLDSTNERTIFIPSIEISSDLVYLSLWSFVGIITGLSILVFLATFGMFIKYSIVPNDFSFSWSTFSSIYTNLENDVLYLRYYIIIFFFGVILSLFTIIIVYQSIKWFSSEVKILITNYFKYDFPEVKIITENG